MKKYFGIIFCLSLFVCLMWCARVERQGRELSEKLIRLHIRADSDEEQAQQLKLKVRDAVTERLTPLLSGCSDSEQAEFLISGDLYGIENTARRVLEENGCPLPVSAALVTETFGEKSYENFTLPAGQYRALRVEIGRAQGQNWWCVVFPPMCLDGASDDDSWAVFSPGEAQLISGDGCVVKFKLLELISALKERICQRSGSL